MEFEADARLTPTLSVNGQLVFTSSHFRGSVATPAIEGNQVPQVPEMQGGVGVTWTDPRIVTAAAQVRFSGEQYDDDLNLFVLGAYGVMDAAGEPRGHQRAGGLPRRREHLRPGVRHRAHADPAGGLAAHVPRRVARGVALKKRQKPQKAKGIGAWR